MCRFRLPHAWLVALAALVLVLVNAGRASEGATPAGSLGGLILLLAAMDACALQREPPIRAALLDAAAGLQARFHVSAEERSLLDAGMARRAKSLNCPAARREWDGEAAGLLDAARRVLSAPTAP